MKVAQKLVTEVPFRKILFLGMTRCTFKKGIQYHGENYVGADGHGNLFSNIFIFMIVGIKKCTSCCSSSSGKQSQWRLDIR